MKDKTENTERRLFAVVQRNLTEKIDRKVLEEASVYVPNIARADCARLHQELFGIVADGLSRDDAIAFQTALEHFGFPTDAVPQEDLPVLPPPKVCRGIRFSSNGFTAFDGLGRETGVRWDKVHFAAGGFLNATVRKSKNVLEWDYRYGPQGSSDRVVRVTKEEVLGKEKEFRLELFLSYPSSRLQFRAGKETLFQLGDARLRFRDEDQFEQILRHVSEVLPPPFLNLGILAAVRTESFLYPSAAAFEEEIVWRLYQRIRP